MARAQPYDDLVMDHIRNARNYRVLDDAHRQATASNPLCGDEITVFLNLDGDKVAEVAFQCSCCGVSMASASMMTVEVRGRHTRDAINHARAFHERLARAAENSDCSSGPFAEAMLETVRRYPARMRCAALPWIALAGLLENAGTGLS